MPTEALFAQPAVRRVLQSVLGKSYDHTHAAYQQFLTRDPVLMHRFQALHGDCYLLTNGTQSHAIASTHALGLYPYLTHMVHANSGVGLKPYAGPYTRLEQLVRSRHAPHVPADHPASLPPIVFFDDRVENHQYPKQRGWTTVWIYPPATTTMVRPPFVDYVFPNVYMALEYFLMVQDSNR